VMYAAGGRAYYSGGTNLTGAANSGDGGGGCRGQNSISDGWAGGSGVVILKLNYS
jgi:hypothetical protein